MPGFFPNEAEGGWQASFVRILQRWNWCCFWGSLTGWSGGLGGFLCLDVTSSPACCGDLTGFRCHLTQKAKAGTSHVEKWWFVAAFCGKCSCRLIQSGLESTTKSRVYRPCGPSFLFQIVALETFGGQTQSVLDLRQAGVSVLKCEGPTGLLKRYMLPPFKTCYFFNTKIRGNHLLQGNAQV